MTPEEIDLLRDLSAPLVENPLPWSELSSEQQSAFRLLMPDADTGFTEEQRTWINLWWLPVSAEQAADIKAKAPTGNQYPGREDIHGDLFVSVDLLSDALDGGRLAALLPILETLPLTYKPPEEWPQPIPEEQP
ncbi:MAG TPA: hypothetical protein VNQ90_15655 [Chthoniobacteraceae bacterium]|nr:hypothetical protein [Chthoniobacteraceae bacterium]